MSCALRAAILLAWLVPARALPALAADRSETVVAGTEKRSFFLEGSNLFAFGSGIEEDFIPFYSRRVGLVGGQVVPLDAGLKLLGRAGPWSIAALDVEAGAASVAAAANLFSGRATYDLDEHLRVGAIATRGDPSGGRENTLLGADALWQTSAFLGDKNLSFGAWAARSDGDLPPGQRGGWGFKADYPNDLWDLFLIYREFGDALEPALGFLPRPGTRQAEGGGAYQPRPPAEGPFGWVRQFFFEMFLSRVDRLDGTTESWRLFTAPFNAVTRSGEHLEANWAPQFDSGQSVGWSVHSAGQPGIDLGQTIASRRFRSELAKPFPRAVLPIGYCSLRRLSCPAGSHCRSTIGRSG